MKIYRVSEFNRAIKDLLSEHVVAIQGEVSNFKVTRNHLVFFDLKDQQSYVSCFLMEFQLDVALEDGMEIQIIGTPSLFLKAGRFHVAVRKIDLLGKGDLQAQFEALRKKLEEEGLFAQERKRPLPAFPESIAVITSEDGAAVTDVMRVAQNRWPFATIILLPVGVQGLDAIPGILRAFAWVNDHAQRLDTVILTRGGGSLEDLQAFNSEDVCRAVFSCHVPVVAGVGHERDTTLVEFVADQRAATPSNAAELATPNREDVLYFIGEQQRRAISGIRHAVSHHKERFRDAVDGLEKAVRAPLRAMDQSISAFQLTVQQFQHRVRSTSDHVQALTKLLHSLSPVSVLERGYSVTRDTDGKTIRDASHVHAGDHLATTLATGTLTSTVQQTYGKKISER